MDLFTAMGLKQDVTVPNHNDGHFRHPTDDQLQHRYIFLATTIICSLSALNTLHLLITREQGLVFFSTPVAERYLSDHACVLCLLKSSKFEHEARLT